METKVIIYKTVNKINGKIYVGKDSHNNPNYLGSGKYIMRAIKKYSKENFVKETIDLAESIEELNEKEKYWIKFYNCKVPNGYNFTDGGEGVCGLRHSEETKKQMGVSHKEFYDNHPEVKIEKGKR
jgi:group I intron endonuclease